MGRPPSARAHEQVLDAAMELFAERGIDNTSMDAISEASGVSKATIYKHWTDKEALCLDVLTRMSEDRPDFNSGDVRADLVSLLGYRPPQACSQIQNRMVPHLMAYAAHNPAFGQAWRARIMEPSRKRLIELLKRAISEGQLARDLDFDLAGALLLGPMMYRHVLTLSKTKPPDDMPQRVVDAFWKAYGARQPETSQRKPGRTRAGHKKAGAR